jgi:dGTPase
MNWKTLLNSQRFMRDKSNGDTGVGRTNFQGDYDRILFSRPFRRLLDKTQVFPMPRNAHIHSRLTHSLEVAAVGRSLGRACGEHVISKYKLVDSTAADFGDIVAAACMAHDIGNPPFGHAGEEAIRMWFDKDPTPPFALKEKLQEQHQDFANFEGNAQGFRIVTRLENHVNAGGLQLTYATLGAFLKYPQDSRNCTKEARTDASRKKHGANRLEADLLKDVCETLQLNSHAGAEQSWVRHPLAFLTEAADDICNGILDVEDGVELGYVPKDRALKLLASVAGNPSLSSDGSISRLRAISINQLIQRATDAFIKNEEAMLAGKFETPLIETIEESTFLAGIKSLNREYCYNHPTVLHKEIAGFEVISNLLYRLLEAKLEMKSSPYLEAKVGRLLPKTETQDLAEKVAEVVDFVSGMTDHFAMDVYQNLNGLKTGL